eukprot:10235187-Ditylum_brightwellii.AAC.1
MWVNVTNKAASTVTQMPHTHYHPHKHNLHYHVPQQPTIAPTGTSDTAIATATPHDANNATGTNTPAQNQLV